MQQEQEINVLHKQQLLIEESTVPMQLRGIIMEKGILSTMSKCQSTEKLEEIVKQSIETETELMKLDVKFAQTRGLLIEKGIMHCQNLEVEQKTVDNNEEFLKNDENFMDQLKEEYNMLFNPEDNSNIEIEKLIDDINQFSKRLEANIENIDWQEFRGNLVKIHQHYTKHSLQDSSKELQDLASQSKTLSKDMECIENKITDLELNVEDFNTKLDQTLSHRDQAAKEIIDLQLLRERIGQKLTLMEMELKASKTRLLLKRNMRNK